MTRTKPGQVKITRPCALCAALGRPMWSSCDRLMEPEVLAFARPDAECIFVGKEVFAHSWPQAKIDAGVLADQPVTVATQVSKAHERCLRTILSQLWQDCEAAQIRSPVVVLIELALFLCPPQGVRSAR